MATGLAGTDHGVQAGKVTTLAIKDTDKMIIY